MSAQAATLVVAILSAGIILNAIGNFLTARAVGRVSREVAELHVAMLDRGEPPPRQWNL